jgi:hypothetical protein
VFSELPVFTEFSELPAHLSHPRRKSSGIFDA